MRITYTYKTIHSDSPITLELTPEQYFDPIEPGENWEDDAIPMFNDGRDYCDAVAPEDFEWGEIIISGSLRRDHRIRTQYYNGAKSCLIYRKDADGFELIIQSVMIKEDLIYISRMDRAHPDADWENVSLSAGLHPDGGPGEKWFNLKKSTLPRDDAR